MSQEIKNVLIIGASGNLGPSIFSAIDASPKFTLSVVSREGSKSTFPSHTKVFTVPASVPEESLVEAFKGQDAIIDLSPLTDTALHHRAIDAAIKAGVKRYIPPEFGSNSVVPEIMEAVPFFAAKAAVTDYLKSKESSGLTWTAVVNGGFFDWGLQNGFLGFDLKAHKALIYNGGDNYTDMTLLSTVGQAVVGILSHPAETANKHVHINSYRLTQNQILASLEKASGSKWTVETTTSEEQRKKGLELLGKHDYSGIGPVIVAMEYSGAEYIDFKKFGLWNETFGLPPTNQGLDEAVAKVVKGEGQK